VAFSGKDGALWASLQQVPPLPTTTQPPRRPPLEVLHARANLPGVAKVAHEVFLGYAAWTWSATRLKPRH
jgi:hypothetical protein